MTEYTQASVGDMIMHHDAATGRVWYGDAGAGLSELDSHLAARVLGAESPIVVARAWSWDDSRRYDDTARLIARLRREIGGAR